MDMESLTLNGTISDLQVIAPQMNGSYSPDESSIEMNGTEVEQNEGSTPTYADAFPPLPAAAPTNISSKQSAWGKPSKEKQPISSSKPILSTTTSHVFKIPVEERKYKNLSPIVGEAEAQNEAIRDIMQKTLTKIEVNVTKDQALTIVVSGNRDAVANAKRSLVAALQVQGSIEIVIPKEHHKFILGKKGQKLKDLEMNSQTRITIPRDSDIIRIVGTKEGIDRARHEMQVISDEQAKLAFEKLNIPKIYHPFICGPNNENLKDIVNMTGARVNIPPPSVQKEEISIAGDKDNVRRAVKMVMDIYRDRERNSKTVSVEVKKSQHRYVIGPRGAGIQEILRQTNVSVEIPPSDSTNITITLRGDKDQLGKALNMVYDRAGSFELKELHAPKWLHRFIIGRGGENIKKITQDLDNKVHIEFVEAKDMITIEGPSAEVQAAENLLSASLDDLKKTMAHVELEIDQKWHRHIIGKNGINIGRIKSDTGTLITIPPDEVKSKKIRIEGSPEGVAAAKRAILDMQCKMENEKSRDIIIEQKYHKNLIGQKGEKVRKIREQFPQVQISFPEPDHKSDIVTLRGPREDVDECYANLKKMAADIIASNYRVDVPILKRFHGNVIGRKGANIKKIKEETNTIIEIPAESSDSDVIVVIGTKENCHLAKKKILAIQKDLANIVSKEVIIPQKLHTSMIGLNGKFIQSIMAECGDINIRFPPEGAKSDVITVRGSSEAVEKAEQQLRKLADEQQEKSFTAEVLAKPEHHRFLIGKKGAHISEIRNKTGARIVFPTPEDENRDVITIIGKKEAVEEARAQLQAKIEALNNVIEGEVSIDPKHHKYLASRGARVLQEVSDNYGRVSISLPKDAESSTVSLKGAKDCVEGAKKRLLEIVDEIESMIEVKCLIPQKHHRNILGNKGKNVQELTSKLNVQIKFPERRKDESDQAPEEEEDGEKNDTILISGKKEQVEKAKEELMALIPITKTIAIPYENHKYIIGQKGAKIRELMETYKVGIVIPNAEENDDLIAVTGPPAAVERALSGLIEENKKIEVEKLKYFELCIKVPVGFHSKLIGHKGESIKERRKQFGVNIIVPKLTETNEDETIKIVGLEEKCKIAAEAIQKIIHRATNEITMEVNIDRRTHSRIIGQGGKNNKKLREKFDVDIRFPRASDDSDIVTIRGLEEDCESCKEHLLMLEEEYMDDVLKRIEEQKLIDAYMKPSRNNEGRSRKDQPFGFCVRDAPWSQKENRTKNPPPKQPAEYKADADSVSDFPTLGSEKNNGGQGKNFGVWGQ